ncbi:MAG: F0F1 ATP synthase subunit epsilon [Cyanophyceae cyanobacterium]
MKLKVMLPNEVLIEQEVDKVIAEAENGHFCLLPHHIDFVAALVPGILIFEASGQEAFLAVDEGILVKCAQEVLVSTRSAVQSDRLELLQQTVISQFQDLDERERLTRSALAKFEINIVRYFQELGHG